METIGWNEILVKPFSSAFCSEHENLRWKLHILAHPRAGEMGMQYEGVK